MERRKRALQRKIVVIQPQFEGAFFKYLSAVVMNMNRCILIADDHVIIRRGIKMILDQYFGRERILEADTPAGLLEQLRANAVTHMILDIQFADINIIDLLPKLREDYPDIPILIYSMIPEDIYGSRLLKMGIKGFLSKQSDEHEAVKALNLFFANREYISENLKDIMTDEKSGKLDNPIKALSVKEISVLNALLNGKTIQEISEGLNVKATTVGTFKARILEKMRVRNLIELRKKCDLYGYKTL